MSRHGVSLVLGGGAARGFAHIGVLAVLDKNKIPIREVIGCSMGSVIGALYCAGVAPKKLEEFVCRLRTRQILKYVDFHWWDDYWVKGDKVRKLITSYLRDCDFKDLKIPLKVVCTQTDSQKSVVLDKGKVLDAIMASSAVPGILPPVKIKNMYYVDGGLCDPLPISQASFRIVIGVNVLPARKVPSHKRYAPFRSTAGLMHWAYTVMQQSIVAASKEKADVLIEPETSSFNPFHFNKAVDLIHAGSRAAEQALPGIRRLVCS